MAQKVIGFQKTHFSFEDGNTCDGYTIWLDVSEGKKDLVGVASERIFVSDRKLNGYIPKLDDTITVNYNRYGKVQSLSF